MVGDRDYLRTLEIGRRNQEVKVLIENWCAHARIEKFGGTGMIEEMTGFPIGNHSMACDHAPPARFTSWFLEEAAVSFYDRNCSSCKCRHPLRLPNIIQIVQERDRKRAESDAVKAREEHELKKAFDSRQKIRDELRQGESAPVAALIEDIQELDQHRTQEAAEKILGTATLAPEVFTHTVVEHLFDLVEANESWMSDTALRCLRSLPVDCSRLVACALQRIALGHDMQVSAEILVSHLDLVQEAQVGPAVKALCFYAAPSRNQIDFSEPEPHPEPLQALASKFAKPVEKALDDLISSYDAMDVIAAARAIPLLYSDMRIPVGVVRGLAAKLVRIDTLVESDRDSEVNEAAHALKCSLVAAFQLDDQYVDGLLLNYYKGATSTGEARIASVYSHLLRLPRNRFETAEPIHNVKPYGTALRRVLQWASSSQNYDVLRQVQEALGYFPEQLAQVVSEQMEFLLGTGALVDEALANLIDVKVAPDDANNYIAHLERENRIQQLAALRDTILEWASSAAAIHAGAFEKFISFVSSDVQWPEQFRSAIVRALPPLMKTGASVNAALPYLYGALVGESVSGRVAAARALQELRRSRIEDLPSLVHDAFVLLLSDPLIRVHQTAVRALERISLPEKYDREINLRLLHIFEVYVQDCGEDGEFLVTCIDLLVSRLHENAAMFSTLGKTFVAVLMKLDAHIVLQRGHIWMLQRLVKIDGFPDLLLKIFQHAHYTDSYDEELISLLRVLPADGLRQIQDKLADSCQALEFGRPLFAACIEVLTVAGEWSTAASIADLSHQALPNSTQMRIRKKYVELTLLATRLEKHLSHGEIEEAKECGVKWRRVLQEIEEARDN